MKRWRHQSHIHLIGGTLHWLLRAVPEQVLVFPEQTTQAVDCAIALKPEYRYKGQ